MKIDLHYQKLSPVADFSRDWV